MESRKKEKLEILILVIIAILLIIFLLITSIHFNQKDQDSSSSIESIIPTSTPIESSPPISTPPANLKPSDSSENSNSTSKPSDNTPSSENNSESSSNSSSNQIESEASVISYWESRSLKLENNKNEEDLTLRENAKQTFTDIVDFLFYGSTIKGYTFEELTTTAKLKVLAIACKIDYKIDEYFPNYKESIKTGFDNLKGKAALLYLETTSKLCESVGNSACSEARQDFNNMKKSFGFTWDMIKVATSSSYQSLKEILNEWYQSIK